MINYTEEQTKIIDSIPEYNIIVDSVPGSGKTTTIVGILNKYREDRILVLVYNSRLKMETREKNKNSNADIHTYHSLGYSMNRKTIDDVTLEELLVTKFHRKFNYRYIIVDEVQDMTNLYFKLVNFVITNNETEFSLCVIGDRNQCIYKLKYADERYLTKANKIYPKTEKKWMRLKLSISFRLTNETADLVNNIIGSNLIKTNKPGKKPILIIEKDPYSKEFEKRFKILINSYISMGYDYEDIFVLFPSIQSVSGNEILANRIENILVKNKINVYVPGDESYSEKLSKNKIAISTYHRVKGLERKIVIIPGFDASYFKYYAREEDDTIIDNAQYVGLTRALDQLILIQFEEPLKFMNNIKLNELCNVISYTNLETQSEKDNKIFEKLRVIIELLQTHLNMIEIDDPIEKLNTYFESELYFGYIQDYINFYLILTNKSEIQFDKNDLEFMKSLFQENLTDRIKLLLKILAKYVLKINSYKTMLTEINNLINGKLVTEDEGTYGITNYLRHINQDLLSQCYGMLAYEIKLITEPMEYLDIPFTSKQKTNEKVTEEIVADLAGIAIPALYQLETTGKTYITKKITNIDMTNKVKSIFRIASNYNSEISGYAHKSDQLTNFDWLSAINITEYLNRMKNIISNNAEYEYEMRINEFNSQFLGSIDCIDLDNIYELKCVKKLKMEHFIQLSLYKYMYLKINMEPLQNKIINMVLNEFDIKSDISETPKLLETTATKIILQDSTVLKFDEIINNCSEELKTNIEALKNLHNKKFYLVNLSTNEKHEINCNFVKLRQMFDYLHKNRRNKLIINDLIFKNHCKILVELSKYSTYKLVIKQIYRNHTIFISLATTVNKKIIQIGYIIVDESNKEIERNEIICNDGNYELDFHRRISLDIKSSGYPEYIGILKIYEILLCSRKIVGHNIISSQSLILKNYFSKYSLPGINYNFEDLLPANKSLSDLYKIHCNLQLDSMQEHNALYDVDIIKQCYDKQI